MCLAVIALAAHPRYALVVATNRDEFHARAAARATWGTAPPFIDIVAGRDLAAGGTWLGARRDGRWALVTNVRDGAGNDAGARSRGELVPRVLNAPANPRAAADDVRGSAHRYNGFNLLAGDFHGAIWMSNRGAGPVDMAAGVHGLSNALLDTPWPKLALTRQRVAAWAAAGDADTAPLFAALADRAQAPDALLPSTGVTLDRERLLSSPFIVSDAYGTRCSTVFTIDHDGRARFHERTFDAAGMPSGEVIEAFDLVQPELERLDG
ncbi:MAG: NRDE family protein [Betaproteobacteria bacterium]